MSDLKFTTNARIEVPCSAKTKHHDWVVLDGWNGESALVKRTATGRRHPQAYQDWVRLICNNPECPGRAVVRLWDIELDPESETP